MMDTQAKIVKGTLFVSIQLKHAKPKGALRWETMSVVIPRVGPSLGIAVR